jgi:ERCC4-type nuclease
MTTEFLNIFSKKPVKIKKEIPKQKIIIDYREKNSLVPAQLKNQGFDIEFQELKIGDYIVNETIIERKTVSDFHQSMINRHLFNQIEELKQYENKLIIVEGLEHQELYDDYKLNGINANALRGFILSIMLKHKIPLIFSKNTNDTVKFIDVLSRKKQKEMPLNAVKKTLNKKEQMQFILESFQGIGPINAKKLLEKFGNLKNIFNASKDELQEILGKKSEIFNLLEEKY